MSEHNTPEIWVIDDDSSIRWVLERVLKKADMRVSLFSLANDALNALPKHKPDVILTDIRMPGMDGLSLLDHIHKLHPDLPVIVVTAYSDLESTVSSYSKGAFDYLTKPFNIEEVVAVVKKAVQSQSSNEGEQAILNASDTGIIGQSQPMQTVFRMIGRLVNSSMNVLITGESGTGKELVANALHLNSPRKDKPFIAINTAAIPKELLESELFGHEKGAFTGAHSRHKGRFESANGGTLFLDEIGDMPAAMQTRLLRVLAEGEFYRVGGHSTIKVDVRIIAATHQNLESRVEQGLFRADLHHRLNVIQIKLPPLRERADDISLLLQHFMQSIAHKQGTIPKLIHPSVTEKLSSLSWPGNIRQLENLCLWINVMVTGHEVSLDDLPDDLKNQTQTISLANWQDSLREEAQNLCQQGQTGLINQLQPQFEKTLLEFALQQTAGKKIEAANLLGWGRNTLTRKLKELDIQPKDA